VILKVFLKALLHFRDALNFAMSQVLFGIRVVKRVWCARLCLNLLKPTFFGYVMHRQV